MTHTFAQYRDSSNPGRPAGASVDGDEDVLAGWEVKRHHAHLPWAVEENASCINCARAKKQGCAEHALGMPKVVVPGAPGPDAVLPCVGEWKLFDTEEPSAKALALCAACPFAEWCRETATQNNEWGTWGGTTQEDRKPKKGLVAA